MRYQRMNHENKKKFMKANAVGRQLAHFKRSMRKLEKLKKTTTFVIYIYTFFYILGGAQIITEFATKGIFAYAQITDSINPHRYKFILSLQTSRFQTLIGIVPLLYYHWIHISCQDIWLKRNQDIAINEHESSLSIGSSIASSAPLNQNNITPNIPKGNSNSNSDEISDVSISHMNTIVSHSNSNSTNQRNLNHTEQMVQNTAIVNPFELPPQDSMVEVPKNDEL